ncbi:MAG: ATP synthase F1 subunit gamma [Bacteroidetes bacterium]|nr:ATP synthase F1 subunit gamma [Bacteroidota bacterium]
MPGQLKEVRNRIKSVQSTQQITKAMKMVSAAKLRKAQDAIVQMRPYAQKLQDTLSNIVSNSDGDMSVLKLAAARDVKRVLVLVVTSDRGLCGAYNTNLIKLTRQLIQEQYSKQMEQGNVQIWGIGKKGTEYFQRYGYNTSDRYRDLFLNLRFEQVQEAAAAAMQAFINGDADVVELVYSEFKNAATQRFKVERFLPIPKVEATQQSAKKSDFIFEPGKETLVAELMPKILNTQLYKAVLDAQASEHGARMTAMDKASENAQELLRSLRISYNRARQAAITTELTEIVSGAAALNG